MFAKGNEMITERKNLTEAVEHLHTQTTLFNLPNGSVDVRVHNHKTTPALSPSYLILLREGLLYQVYLRFRDMFKKSEQPDRWVFSTEPKK